MLRFIYEMPFDDVVRESCYSKLLFYFKLYRIGDKFLLPRLKEYVLDTIRGIVPVVIIHHEFAAIIAETYNPGYLEGDGLRELLVGSCHYWLEDFKVKKDFQEVVRKYPQFAADLVLYQPYSLGDDDV